MKYYIHYSAASGTILERRPQDAGYPDPVPEPYILVNELDFVKTLDGTMRINLRTNSLEKIPVTIQELKNNKKMEISAFRYKAERAGMSFKGKFIATDDVSQNKITSAVLSAMEDSAYTIPEWLCADGTFMSLSNEDIFDMRRALRNYVQDKFRINKELFVRIDAATTLIELEAIEWSDEN